MAIFHITIEKVVTQDNEGIKKILKEINAKVDLLLESTNDKKTKQEIFDSLTRIKTQLEKTI